jgi:hypothetical protein
MVDMVLEPVNRLSKATASLPCQPQTANVGTGTSLTRGIEHMFTLQNIATDKCSDLNNHFFKAKQEPIAIVGMAVNMPGAPNVGRLWDILANGSNTVEEVRFEFILSFSPDLT